MPKIARGGFGHLHSKGPALGTWHRWTIPAVNSEVSELQRSIAKAVVDFHDLDNDGKISGQREEWQLALRMLFDSKKSNGMYGEI